mmetsp:Transcript_107346/g.256404  ORF Transcript_107346/g.256404 Transcript_107346/m.256404 type:complete len:293 (+) Transcript_107346:251-1129(+)
MLHLLLCKHLPPLLGRQDLVIIIVGMLKEHLHLLPVGHTFCFHGPQHDLVVLLGDLEGLLHEDAVDDSNTCKAEDYLVQEAEHNKPGAHLLLEHPSDRRPIAERYLKHRENTPGEIAKVLENDLSICQINGFVLDIEKQDLAQQEGKGHLYEDQQCCDPNQCMHASIQRCRHDCKGIESLNSARQLYQAKQSCQSQQAEERRIEGQVLQRPVSYPKPHQSEIEPVPDFLKIPAAQAPELDGGFDHEENAEGPLQNIENRLSSWHGLLRSLGEVRVADGVANTDAPILQLCSH